jgi:large repetitive protein
MPVICNSVRETTTTAVVSSATATRIVASVPSGATTGPISITSPIGSATSTSPFTVAASRAPTITSFSPDIGLPGTPVSITGTNFEAALYNNRVAFNLGTAKVNSATTTTITTVVPAKASSGQIVVTTPYGKAISANDFYVLPTLPSDLFATSEIVSKGRIQTDGASVAVPPVSLSVVDKIAVYVFDGTRGQFLGLGVNNLSCGQPSTGMAFLVYGPDNARLEPGFETIAAPGSSFNIPKLPISGTYQIIIYPNASDICSMTLTLSTDTPGNLSPNGAVLTFNPSRVGQNARYSFSGIGGQSYSVQWSGNTFSPGAAIQVIRPDGVELNSASISGTNGTLHLPHLPVSGTYSVFVDPIALSVGQVSIAIKQAPDSTGSLALDGPPSVLSIAAGQNARYTFAGIAGQNLGLGVSALTTTPAGGAVAVSVYKADNTLLVNCNLYSGPGGSCNLITLPLTGNYTVLVDPQGTYAANVTLTLSTDVPGSLTGGAAPLTFSTTRVGQNARYSFSGATGQNYFVQWSGSTFTAGGSIRVIQPDGVELASNVTGASNGILSIATLPISGTYSVFVDPAGLSLGQISIALKQVPDATGTVPVGGTSSTIALNAGQSARYAVSATAGQQLGLGVSVLATAPAGGSVAVRVYKPDGALLLDCSSFYAPGGDCTFPMLPVSGTYTVLVDPSFTYAANVSLTVSPDAAGTLIGNGPELIFNSARVGQNARYTFSGAAGRSYSIQWSGNTFPDYTPVYVTYPTNGNGNHFFHVFGADGTYDIGTVPDTGTYTIFIDPQQMSVGQATIALKLAPIADDIGSLPVNAATRTLSLVSEQDARYTFPGTAGQSLGLGVSALSTTPAGGSVAVTVNNPDGTLLRNCGSFLAPGGSCNLSHLPATGTYTVLVDPQATNASGLALTLSSDATGGLTPNGVALTFSTARVGQDARYTFSGIAGQNAALQWSGSTFATSTPLVIIQPNGVVLATSSLGTAAGSLDLTNLPVSGTYTVFIDPYSTSVGQVAIALKQDATGSLALDGASSTLSLASEQNARYTFTATAGQNLGLGLSAFTTTPSGGSVALSVYKPDGTLLQNCSLYAAPGGNCERGHLI